MDSTPDENQQASELPEEVAKPQDAEAPQAAVTPEPQAQPHRPSADEALAAMRRDLRAAETEDETGARGLKRLMRRIFRRRKPHGTGVTEEPSRLDELQFPEPPVARLRPPVEPVAEQPPAPESQPAAAAPEEAKPDFQSMVRTRLGDAFSPETIQREPLEMQPPAPVEEEEGYPSAPAHSILTTLRQEEESAPEQESVDFRRETLEDYVVATEEPEEERGPALTRRLKRSWRYMRPTEKRLLIAALVIVGLALLGGGGYAVIASAPTPTVAATPTPSIEPIPISVSLPGGWVFPLSVGYVNGGQWNSKGAEWLGGTVVCRWVSLPWSEQLEAVVRTFKANDQIQLSMSNYDSILYKVQSIEQVPSSDIGKLCPEGPSLLLMLAKEGTDTHWVAIAKP